MGARSGVRFGAKPLVGVAVAALGLAFAPAAQAANFDVTRLDDPAPSGCASGVDCSLREAVIDANASLGPDTIGLPAPPAGQSYELTQPGPFEDNAMTGDLDLLGDVTITGAGSGAGPATIDANGMDRVFQVGDFGGATPSVELTGLTITGGDIDVGGGVWVIGGDLTVKNSVVTRNSVITEGPGRGGGLALESFTGTSHATISDSTFSHNTAQQSFGGGLGGGIYVGEGQLTLLRSTIGPGNLAEGTSGAFSDPAQGGGIYNADEATLTNVTVSGNSVGTGNNGAGGGIYSAVLQGPVSTVIESSTIVENTVSGPGGQGGNLARDTGAGVTLLRTLVAGGSAASGANCGSTVTSQGNNLESPTNQCGFGTALSDQFSVPDPLLGPLTDNEGLTLTHALLDGSPAIDTGGADCPPPDTDQRGVVRAQGPECDIGAYELRQGSEIVDPITDTCKGRQATIIGEKGPDVIQGTDQRDIIVSRSGDDKVFGNGGNDLICARGGEDLVKGNGGNDELRGDGGEDDLEGGGGEDVLHGANNDDFVAGNSADDEVHGGDGDDDLNGGPGSRDKCLGEKGRDIAISCEVEFRIP